MTNLEEIAEAIRARVGNNHAEFVVASFSLTNMHAAYQMMLRQLSAPGSEAPLAQFDELYNEQIAVLVRCFAVATIKQSADWATLSQPEQHARLAKYLSQLRDDTMLLANKQQKP